MGSWATMSSSRQPLSSRVLAQDGFLRTRTVFAADARDRAVGTAMRAPFGDLEVGERLAGETQTGHFGLDPVLGDALPDVHTGELGLCLRIALRIASGDDDGFEVAVGFELDGPLDFRLGFFARGFDERAGVDDDHIRPVGVGREGEALLEKVPRAHLKVGGVLGAPERDERQSPVSDFPSSHFGHLLYHFYAIE